MHTILKINIHSSCMLHSLNLLSRQGSITRPILAFRHKLKHNLLQAYFAQYNIQKGALVLIQTLKKL